MSGGLRCTPSQKWPAPTPAATTTAAPESAAGAATTSRGGTVIDPELDGIVTELRRNAAEYRGEKNAAFWAGYAAGLLRALEIIEEQP